eukprot:SAG31_NODE_33611_length_342_cov_0.530864_1_plen_24_part_01
MLADRGQAALEYIGGCGSLTELGV